MKKTEQVPVQLPREYHISCLPESIDCVVPGFKKSCNPGRSTTLGPRPSRWCIASHHLRVADQATSCSASIGVSFLWHPSKRQHIFP